MIGIVSGTRSKLMISEPISTPCPNCGEAGLVMYVYQQWCHFCYIPFFPTGKTGATVCLYCNDVIRKNKMPPGLKAEYKIIKNKTSIPIWTFSFTFLLIVLILALVIYGNLKDSA